MLLDDSGVEERSEVMYWHRGAYIYILQRHNVSQLYSVTDGGLRPRVYDYIIIRNTARMTKIGYPDHRVAKKRHRHRIASKRYPVDVVRV